MPRLGWDMKVGSVAEWVKHDGDRVEVGETICMIAGDKATTELEALDSGTLRIPRRSPEVGEEVPVGTLLAYLVAPGEDLAPDMVAPPSAPTRVPGGAPTAVATPPTDAAATAPRDAAAVLPTGFVRGHVGGVGESERRTVATPRARRAAAANGIDWHALVGSGRGGRVLERDIQAAAAARAQIAQVHASQHGEPDAPEHHAPVEAAAGVKPLQGARRVTAERMSLSARTVAAVTLTTEADATTLVQLRNHALAERQDGSAVPTYTDFMVKLVARALAEHPALNAELTEAGIVQHAHINVGVAVDTPAGLFVPVVRDAASRSLQAIAHESARLIAAVKDGHALAEHLAGATFTLTNLGMFEIDAFTPIVNLPQCAILGLGRIVARPVVVDEATEQVAVRRMLALSLTFDHRLVDGAPAARFLQRIKHFVERPTLWLFS